MSSGDTQEDDGRVTLHVYDAGMSELVRGMNHILRPFGSGAFHCGVEVHGLEWSFSDTSAYQDADVSGIFFVKPRCAEGHRYVESICLGYTGLSSRDVLGVIDRLDLAWPGESYDVLERNCCHFCSEMCRELGVEELPEWLTCLAARGAALQRGIRCIRSRRQRLLDFTGAACTSHCCETDPACSETICIDTDEKGECGRHPSQIVRL